MLPSNTYGLKSSSPSKGADENGKPASCAFSRASEISLSRCISYSLIHARRPFAFVSSSRKSMRSACNSSSFTALRSISGVCSHACRNSILSRASSVLLLTVAFTLKPSRIVTNFSTSARSIPFVVKRTISAGSITTPLFTLPYIATISCSPLLYLISFVQ